MFKNCCGCKGRKVKDDEEETPPASGLASGPAPETEAKLEPTPTLTVTSPSPIKEIKPEDSDSGFEHLEPNSKESIADSVEKELETKTDIEKENDPKEESSPVKEEKKINIPEKREKPESSKKNIEDVTEPKEKEKSTNEDEEIESEASPPIQVPRAKKPSVGFVDENDNSDDECCTRIRPQPTPHPAKRGSVPSLGGCSGVWYSQDDDENTEVFTCGVQEPPATPIGRDELALRRHRFFADLITASAPGSENHVRFDPMVAAHKLSPFLAGFSPSASSAATAELDQLITRLERVTSRLETVLPQSPTTPAEHCQSQSQEEDFPPPPPPPPPTPAVKNFDIESTTFITSDNMSVQAYEDLLKGPFASFIQLSTKIGGDVADHAKLVEKAFQAQLEFLLKAASRGPPANQNETIELLKPTSGHIQAIQEFREKHRGSQYFNHLSAVSESIPALGWVAISPAPAPYVKEMNDAGQFYTNRVLKDWKEKDKKHVEWTKAWVQTLSELQKLIKQHHTTGLVWGGRGGGPGAPPPPPPGPPPPPLMGDLPPAVDLSGADRSALFAQINRGEGITSTLKRVTSDMQTHKNQTLRTDGVVRSAGSGGSTTSTPKAPVSKPPVFSRDGKKWLVEYQKSNHNLVIDGTEMNNVVYAFRCEDSTLTVKGKINSIFLDSCKKTSVVFDSVVSSVEFVNCQSVQMQVLGKVPTISIDKSDGCQMYLSQDSLSVEIVSSKSTEMNVMVPKGNGDYSEHPIPEQFKTTWTGSALNTIVVENKG